MSKIRRNRRLAQAGTRALIAAILADKGVLLKILINSILESSISALVPFAFAFLLREMTPLAFGLYVAVFSTHRFFSRRFFILLQGAEAATMRGLNARIMHAMKDAPSAYLKEVAEKESSLHSSQLKSLASGVGKDVLYLSNSLMIILFNLLGVWLAFELTYMLILLGGCIVQFVLQQPLIKVNRTLSEGEKALLADYNNHFNSIVQYLDLYRETGYLAQKISFTKLLLLKHFELFQKSERLRGTMIFIAYIVPMALVLSTALFMSFDLDVALIASLHGYIVTIVPEFMLATRMFVRLAEYEGNLRHLGMVLNAPAIPEGKNVISGIRTISIEGLKISLNEEPSKDQSFLIVNSLIAKQGGFYCLCGASGSGKSTFVSLLVCRLTNIAGPFRWTGSYQIETPEGTFPVLEILRESLSNYIHICTQTPELGNGLDQEYKPATGRQSIATRVLKKGKVPEEYEELVQKAAEAVQLTHKLDQSVDSLSGGEKSRVSIARALFGCMLYPGSLLILDESVSSLNTSLAKEVIDAIISLQEEYQFTVFMITHMPETNPKKAIAWVFGEKDGVRQIVETGTVGELEKVPTSHYNLIRSA